MKSNHKNLKHTTLTLKPAHKMTSIHTSLWSFGHHEILSATPHPWADDHSPSIQYSQACPSQLYSPANNVTNVILIWKHMHIQQCVKDDMLFTWMDRIICSVSLSRFISFMYWATSTMASLARSSPRWSSWFYTQNSDH